MKKIILSFISLSLIALVAVFTNTIILSPKNTLLMKSVAALAQLDPNKPPFTCTDGPWLCWVTVFEVVEEEDGTKWQDDPIFLYKP